MLFHLLSADFNHFYGWGRWGSPGRGSGNIHVMAKLPDGQSAAEKAAIMVLGAHLGVRHFGCAGTLSLDEIFSAEQLLLDCEIRDWVQRSIQGVQLGEGDVQDWLAEVKAGIHRGYMGLDSTLDHHQQHVWYPRFFQRGAVGQWLEKGQPKLSQRLRQEAKRRIAAHNFELDATRRAEIERIYASACKAVGN
jgi:trimethylamine:corrinoid methyltransferase-like protein